MINFNKQRGFFAPTAFQLKPAGFISNLYNLLSGRNRPARLVLHNDSLNEFSVVCQAVGLALDITLYQSEQLVFKAHNGGSSILCVGSVRDCELRLNYIRDMVTDSPYNNPNAKPLTITVDRLSLNPTNQLSV